MDAMQQARNSCSHCIQLDIECKLTNRLALGWTQLTSRYVPVQAQEARAAKHVSPA
jgi:hypothetical protein